MRIQLHSRFERAGYALALTLVFTGIILLLFASLMYWAASNAKVTKRNNLYNQSQAAAESAVELVLSTMMRDFAFGGLNPANSYTSLVPSQTGWPIQFLISDTNGNANQVSVYLGPTNWISLPFQYTGLNGLGQECVISAMATPQNQGENLSAPVTQKIWFGSIPIFQFAIFYNLDLEINPGDDMNVNGKVHSNQNIWATGAGGKKKLTFSDVVEAAQKVTLTPSPKDPHNTGRNGNVNFTLTANNPQSNANSLNLPIIGGTNRDPLVVRAILGLPPASLAAPLAAAYTSEGQLYPYNEADLVISNAPTGTTNLTVYYQNGNLASPLTKLSPDATNTFKVSGIWYTNVYFSFVTNVTFYDYRENCNVKAVQIDVAKLRMWLTNASGTGGKYYDDLNYTNSLSAKGHHIDSIYVYNAVPFTAGSKSSDGQLPAVRIVNGQRLPTNGLTVATSQPIYVKGNYNVTRDDAHFAWTQGSTTNAYTWPAAFMADAITILSTNWSDAKVNGVGNRPAVDTTINAACFEGIDESDGSDYSGGVENFLRLLENWSGDTLTYNGSIVVMFPSQYAIEPWQTTGNYYNPPTRKWGFDTTFYTQSGIPPMTPQVKATIREAWASQ